MEAISHAAKNIDSRPFELMMTHSEMQPAGYIKTKAVLLANSRVLAKNTELSKPVFDPAYEARRLMNIMNKDQHKDLYTPNEFLGLQLYKYSISNLIETVSLHFILEPVYNSSEKPKDKTPIVSRSSSGHSSNLKHQILIEKYRANRFPRDLELVVSDGLKSVGLLDRLESDEGKIITQMRL